jgi:hypothetical protein
MLSVVSLIFSRMAEAYSLAFLNFIFDASFCLYVYIILFRVRFLRVNSAIYFLKEACFSSNLFIFSSSLLDFAMLFYFNCWSYLGNF